MRSLLQYILRYLARWTVAKYKPRIIGVTGSVGKTSARVAITAVVAELGTVRQSPKNLNNELGLPLAIIGAVDSAYRQIGAWFGIVFRALYQLVVRNEAYPEFLVLEYGVDKPGDMQYLTRIAKPLVAVVTAVAPTHLEQLGSVEEVAREKRGLVQALSADGVAVLNSDDAVVAGWAKSGKHRVVTFGLGADAGVHAEAIRVSQSPTGEVKGVTFKLESDGNSVPVPGVVGEPPVYAVLAAAAVGVALGVSPIRIAQALQTVHLPPGRLRVLLGQNSTTLIDDTYNSSPQAVKQALRALAAMPLVANTRRWAVLGDMLELGKDSQQLHRAAGVEVKKSGVDFLVTVGQESHALADGALAAGFPADHAWHFTDAVQAGKFVRDKVQPGDVVLIKGSQGVRCEKVTKELIAEPERAHDLLVRQYAPWV